MKKIIPILLLIIPLASLAACGGKTSALEVSDPQQPIMVEAGREFSIVLEANPTTGYHWDVMEGMEQGVVEFVKNEYISTSDPGLMGGGGLDVWTFKAVKTGEVRITLGYYPPSNDLLDPQQTTTFTVIVK